MNFFKRLKNIWTLSSWSPEDGTRALEEKITVGHSGQKAEFLMPDRINEILSKKPNATIDEVL